MRVLLAARGLRHLRTLEDFIGVGFVIVDDQEPQHLILGLVGQPWRPSGNLQRLSATELLDFDQPGFVRVLWSFSFDSQPEGCRVHTSTEIYATDRRAQRSFGRYWWLVKPFSGMMRRSMLRSIKRCAEV